MLLALALARAEAGELEAALRGLEEAHALFPDAEALNAERIAALARVGEVEAALAEARRWSHRSWAAKIALKLLSRHGRQSEAIEFEAAVAEADPADPDLFDCRAARRGHDPEVLLRLCDAVLVHDPGAAHALYQRIVALVRLGRDAEAADLLGLDRFLWAGTVPAPPPFEGDEPGFLAALAEEILANPTLHRDPAGHATSNGLRTGIYPAATDRAAPALVTAIKAAIGAYAERLGGDHPFVRAQPARARFTPWALVFAGTGRQRLHAHPGCWLTGVYYVAAPDGSPRPGAIRIGGLPASAGVDPPWPPVEIEPEPGRLLLFPSFVPHETVPSGSGEVRISVAFDVAAV